MIFSRVCPLWVVLLQPYMVFWLLKSPSRIKGVGSCCNMLLNSLSFMASWGGIYMEQILIVLCKVILTAIAWSWVLRWILLWGMSFLIRTETPPKLYGRYCWWNCNFGFFFIVISSSVLRNVSWRQTMAGCWVINKSSLLLIALIPRQFHWIILWFIVKP